MLLSRFGSAFRRLIAAALLLYVCVFARGQIVNRLGVDPDTFQRYAYGRMQQFAPSNLHLADSLYSEGAAKDSYKLKCLGLSLEFPVRFAEGDYPRMDEAVAEIKDLTDGRKDASAFRYAVLHEYCEYLVHIGRSSDAMLEAREMERRSNAEKKAIGKMYAYRIIGLIQSYRSNSYLATVNLKKAVKCSREASQEQDLPNLYLLIAQEYIKMRDFSESSRYCDMAAAYEEFYPSLHIRIMLTRAYQLYAQKKWDKFSETYLDLLRDPLYRMQTDMDTRHQMDIYYCITRELFDEALSKADSLSTPILRHGQKHGIYASKGVYDGAYSELSSLMVEKDSIYIKVQNEDLAILDAEMNNAALREEAQRLKSANQMMIMIGFLVMFAIAFFAILLSQWQLRQNLDEMRRKNNQNLATRRAFQKAMDAKESENDYRIKILQNRTTNILTNYEDFLNS